MSGQEHGIPISTVRYPKASELAAHHFQSECGYRLRHRQQTRCPGGIAKADLVKQREEKGHCADSEPGHEAAEDGNAKGADSKKIQREHRCRSLPGMPAIRREQHEG